MRLADETIGLLIENLKLAGFDKNDSLISDTNNNIRFENFTLSI